jgi:hypothetical protein
VVGHWQSILYRRPVPDYSKALPVDLKAVAILGRDKERALETRPGFLDLAGMNGAATWTIRRRQPIAVLKVATV